MSMGLEGPSGTFVNPSQGETCPMCGQSMPGSSPTLPDQQPRTLDQVANEFFQIVTRDGGVDPQEQQIIAGLLQALSEFAANGGQMPPGAPQQAMPGMEQQQPGGQQEYGGNQGEPKPGYDDNGGY